MGTEASVPRMRGDNDLRHVGTETSVPILSAVHRPRPQFDNWIATGLLITLFFAMLAHDAGEPCEMEIFDLMLVGLLLLGGIKAARERRLEIDIPTAASRIAALT